MRFHAVVTGMWFQIHKVLSLAVGECLAWPNRKRIRSFLRWPPKEEFLNYAENNSWKKPLVWSWPMNLSLALHHKNKKMPMTCSSVVNSGG